MIGKKVNKMNKLTHIMMIMLLVAGVVTAPVQSVYAEPVEPPVTVSPSGIPPAESDAFAAEESLLATTATPMTNTFTLISDPRLDMKVLVIYGNGYEDSQLNTEHPYNMVKSYLDILGIPYDTVNLRANETISEADLSDGVNHGYYYAIFFTTSDDWWSLPPETRAVIAAYERNFGVRQVTWYSVPNPEHNGLVCVFGNADCTNVASGVSVESSKALRITPAGESVFPYLQPDTELSTLALSLYTYGYPATTTLTTAPQVTPLFLDEEGNIAMAIFRSDDGREHLVFTWSSFYPAIPPINVHARVLPYGIINWATKGLFLGERHVYFVPQPDDIFMWGDGWDSERQEIIVNEKVHRLTPAGLDNLVAWMEDLKTNTANAADFKIEMPFNGLGTEEDRENYASNPPQPLGDVLPGTLTAKGVALEDEFIWLNHTYTHVNLNDVDYTTAADEISKNNELAELLAFTDYTTTTLLTGAYSGLQNPDFINAAYDLGIRYLLANASVVPTYTIPSPNTGIPHPFNPEILLVPRHANNIFYFVVTPQDEAEFYNIVYTDTVKTYEQIIDTITNQSLENLLDFNVNATMFHVNNLIAYNAPTQTNTILSDFVESLYSKYNALYNNTVPILSLRTQEIGQKMWERMAYDVSGVSAVWQCGDAITLSTVKTAIIPITGINASQAVYTETYAGQDISYFAMGENDTLYIPGAAPSVPERIDSLSVDVTDTQNVLTWDAVTTDTNGAPTQALFYRVYRKDGNDVTLLADRVTATTYTDSSPIAGATYIITAIGDNCWRLESENVSATPTTLLDFSTNVLDGTVAVTKTTDVETDTLGLNLHISTPTTTTWTQVNGGIIPTDTDHVYTFTDPYDRCGGSFYYRLEEVETPTTGSATIWYEPVTRAIGQNAVLLVKLVRQSIGMVPPQLFGLVVIAVYGYSVIKRRNIQ